MIKTPRWSDSRGVWSLVRLYTVYFFNILTVLSCYHCTFEATPTDLLFEVLLHADNKVLFEEEEDT